MFAITNDRYFKTILPEIMESVNLQRKKINRGNFFARCNSSAHIFVLKYYRKDCS